MTMYEFWLFLHLLGAITWVGGDILLQVYGTRLQRANDPVQMAQFAGHVEWIGIRLLTPASV